MSYRRSEPEKLSEVLILQLTYPLHIRGRDESWEQHLGRLEKIQANGGDEQFAYNVVLRSLNAANYGVPQTRERIFIVGFRSDLAIEWAIEWSFPEPTHSHEELLRSKWVTGEYWDRHRIPALNRPQPPEQYRRKIEKMRSCPPLSPAF